MLRRSGVRSALSTHCRAGLAWARRCPAWRAARCRCASHAPALRSRCCVPPRNGCPAGKANGACREASRRPCQMLSPATRRHKGTPLLRSEPLSSETREQPWLEQLSWHPRAFPRHGYCSCCPHMLNACAIHSASRRRVGVSWLPFARGVRAPHQAGTRHLPLGARMRTPMPHAYAPRRRGRS